MDEAMNMSDDDANDQFDQQLNELLAASGLDKDQKQTICLNNVPIINLLINQIRSKVNVPI